MSAADISSFLGRIRDRLNQAVALRVIAWGMLGAAAVGVGWAIGWRVFGYAAPWLGYGVISAMVTLGGIVWLMRSRREIHDAARSADAAFHLKDGLISWLDFKARNEKLEAFQLHEKSVARKVAGLDAKSLEIERPKWKLAGGLGLAALVVALAFIPHSEAVRKRLESERLTAERSGLVAKEMEDAVEELIRQLSAEERELLDENKLREWTKEIGQTKDARAAEKQLAKIEQQIGQTLQGLEARQDEAVLKLAAEELEKSSSADVRQLGKQLDAKNFEKAAERLKRMKPASEKKMTPEQLRKRRENAAKSKEMAKRMTDGAKRRDFGKMGKSEGKAGAMKPADGNQKPIGELLGELDAEARQLDKELAENEEGDEDAEVMVGKLGDKMDELGKRLGKLGARAKAKDKLGKLRAGLGQAREFSQGKAQVLGLAQSQEQEEGEAGDQAGVGSSESRREEKDELKDNGNRTEIRGQGNPEGPSSTSIEEAESGGGIAGRASVAKEREFKQQYESLVHRDDIPESLKLGIREYFEKVHETASEETK